jgi:predicted transcriptional regulator
VGQEEVGGRVEQWAEIRRMHFVSALSIKEIARRTGRDRNTVRRARSRSREATVVSAASQWGLWRHAGPGS